VVQGADGAFDLSVTVDRMRFSSAILWAVAEGGKLEELSGSDLHEVIQQGGDDQVSLSVKLWA